jgi:hypothetical protein
MRVARSAFPSRAAQRGISLIIAMLMLVVIGLASVAIIRNATSADRAVNNNRLQTQANQFAQAALQFCENQLVVPTGRVIKVQPALPLDTPGAWTVKAHWFDPNIVHTLTPAEITGTNAPKVPPQCMAEGLGGTGKFYIVTARGFSDDYAQDSDHATTSGSVVWLQSTVKLP